MFKYVLLGLLQGITEFLPVSSSGHLVIAEKLFGISDAGIALTVVMHLGTLIAVVVFFFPELMRVFRSPRPMLYILTATLITAGLGLGVKSVLERYFLSNYLVGICLLISGLVLIFTGPYAAGKREDIKLKDSIIFGLAQGIAVLPGLSRSGVTISSLLFRGISRDAAFSFSFLASIPAVGGAAILEMRGISSLANTSFKYIAAGFASSLIFGLLALWLLKVIVRRAKFHYFGYYCIIAGLLTLFLL